MAIFDLNEPYDDTSEAIGENEVEQNQVLEENEVVEEDQIVIHENNYVQQAVQMLDGVNVPEPTAPTENMEFDSGDEFAALCYMYAYKKGFSWRVRSSTIMEAFKAQGVCHTGTGDKEPQFYMMNRIKQLCNHTNKTINPHVPCTMYVDGRIVHNGDKFVITKFNSEHNHDLDPSNTRHVVNYRHIGEYFKKRMMINDRAGIPITRNYNALVMECEGYENISFTQRDMRNAINKERRKGRLRGDAQELLNYFEKLKSDNPDYYYAIETDENGALLNLFWADARCRAMYKSFGDPLSYDTTFLSNMYKIPFSPFVGVNHHGSTVIFAAALISYEDTESFEWVFRKWIDCMGEAPKVMITDQCKTMEGAIRRVFPNTKHRLCLWHILQNADKNLRAHQQFQSIDRDLRSVVHDSLTEDEFETSWMKLVHKYNLGQHNWMRESWAIRRRWVPVYWRDTFCAGMSSTQRSEQSNRYFKSFISVETGLKQFVEQFEVALRRKAEEENVLNYNDKHNPAKWEPRSFFEDVYHNVYTNKKFKEVQDQVFLSYNTHVEDQSAALGFIKRFKAHTRVLGQHWTQEKRTFEVSIDTRNGIYKCQCRLFEFSGILCGHIMKCLDVINVTSIPETYILNRWRKDIVRGYETICVGYYDPHESERVKRKMRVKVKQDHITNLACMNDDAEKIYDSTIKQAVEALEAHAGVQPKEKFTDGTPSPLVWGRRRVQRKEKNTRTTNGDGQLKDPPCNTPC